MGKVPAKFRRHHPAEITIDFVIAPGQHCYMALCSAFMHWKIWRGAWGLAVLGLWLASAAPAAAQARVALVIGVGAYRAVPPLANPPNDARAIAEALQKADFQVETVIDPARDGIERAIRNFGARARHADVALFFYAGHAVEFGGKNYLVPATAAIQSERDLPFETVDLDLLASQINGASRTTILILDSCRDDPFSLRLGSGSRGIASRGMAAPFTTSTGTLIAYATAPGQVASDGAAEHSPFTRALLDSLPIPGLEIRQMLGRVRRQVREATGGQQVPWESSALEGDFYFYPVAASGGAPPVAALPQVAPVATVAPVASFPAPVRPAPRPVRPVAVPPAGGAVSGRCAAIMERTQLGEALSDADRSTLHTCR